MKPKAKGSTKPLALGFLGGVGAVLLFQLVAGTSSQSPTSSHLSPFLRRHFLYARDAPAVPEGSFPADIGSTLAHEYPPSSPTNADAGLFPTQVGFAGGTITGAEAFVVATAVAYPTGAGVAGLVDPGVASGGDGTPSWIDPNGGESPSRFSIFQSWSNLSPAYSVPKGAFGVQSTPEVPAGCTLKGVHILHRHGSRYPGDASGYASPAALAAKFHNATATIKGHGALSFINSWTYKLGTAMLNHFGRQQMFDLGVSMRMKYGQLLEGFTDTLPVLRTESQDRMLASSVNFAFGFFGWPLEGKFLQEVTIEATGYNNTLAPYTTCPNSNVATRGYRGATFMQKWIAVYLKDARTRIQALLTGYTLTLEDVFSMQTMCAYETTALGYSAFCPLFTQAEWEGFEYAWDIQFWYNSGFGSPVARVQGAGYVLELLSRLTHTPISSTSNPLSSGHLFSVNTTLTGNPTTFPLNNTIYSDATHEVVLMNIYTALNLSVLAQDGQPSLTRMKRGRKWVTSRFAPFGSNMQVQVLTCDAKDQLRIIVNDAPVALSGISGCPSSSRDGLCPVEAFVAAQRTLLDGTDWDWACLGNWTVPDGWTTVTGDPPARSSQA
ncbi:hypothetical protein M408DRAFT_77931 [Serendipita vermifera MAFF 305830]|uniref:3-phytase n=1 Tax=Serendipita vermifera MAFF 305830 TaxID=933852 RepID=A0A0C3AEX0_SERVB|nr:hypothetical protein M408DRAFT_77931 [Serendipita vermifera MAFF 305830]